MPLILSSTYYQPRILTYILISPLELSNLGMSLINDALFPLGPFSFPWNLLTAFITSTFIISHKYLLKLNCSSLGQGSWYSHNST